LLTVLAVVKVEAPWGLVAVEQRTLAEFYCWSLPIVQKTEASERMIHGKGDPFSKVGRAVKAVRVGLLGERAVDDKGRRRDTSESARLSLGTSPYFVRAAGG